MIEHLVAEHLAGCGGPSEQLEQRIFNEIAQGVYGPSLTPTYPWMPKQLFDDAGFRTALLGAIESQISCVVVKKSPDFDARRAQAPLAEMAETSHPVKGRRRAGPTPQQQAIADKQVAEMSEVTTRTAAWWLRCSAQHIRRLARNGYLKASGTRPMVITTDSLRSYKWPQVRGEKDEN